MANPELYSDKILEPWQNIGSLELVFQASLMNHTSGFVVDADSGKTVPRLFGIRQPMYQPWSCSKLP